MRINHNISALNTYRQLTANNNATSASLQKLSSGLRINSAADDAAGLAISEKMRGQIRGLDQSTSNANDGISLIQTAEGALNETHSILQRMRELAVQSANDTNTDNDRSEIQKEIEQLTSEITRISTDTQFNTKNLLDGTMAATATDNSADVNASVAAGATLESGVYDVKISNYEAEVEAVPASNVSVTGTYTGAGETYTFHKAGFDQGGTTLAADGWYAAGATTATDTAGFTAVGITVNGTGQEGAKITAVAPVGGSPASGGVVSRDVGSAMTVAGTSTSTSAVSYAYVANDGSGNPGWTDVNNGNAAITVAQMETAMGLATGSITGTAVAGTSTIAATAYVAAVPPTTPGSTTVTNVNAVEHKDAKYDTTITTGTGAAQVEVSSKSFDFDFGDAFTAGASGTTFQVTVDASKALVFHIGANQGQNTTLNMNKMDSTSLGIDDLDLTTQKGADSAITTIDKAITTVSAQRAALGAMQNRLEHTINNLSATSENLAASESQIRDVDMAKEMMEYTKNNILSQAAQSMLAQANQQPQNVLQLLQ